MFSGATTFFGRGDSALDPFAPYEALRAVLYEVDVSAM
jgi:hypothetical protein